MRGGLRASRISLAIAATLLLGGTAYALLAGDSTAADILIYTLIWCGIATAWNISAGYAGRLSLGHAAYFGIGAYASSILYLDAAVSPLLGLVVGMLAAAATGAVIEATTIRLSGIYYGLATFAIAELLSILARGWTDLTGGTSGLTLPFKPSLIEMTFAGKAGYLWIALAFAAVSVGVSSAILRSRFGFYLRAQRDDAVAARAVGVDGARCRLAAGVVSAALTAAGGTIYAQYLLYIDPDVGFNWYISVQAAALCIIGGLGTVAGPLFGGLLLIPLERLLYAELGQSFGGLAQAIYGFLLIVVVLAMPQGLVVRIRSLVGSSPAREPAGGAR
jgi:branched-chain amino acid transport system permease protein